MNQASGKAKKKVMLVVTKSNLGGAQRYVYDLATNLPEERFEAVVVFGAAEGSASPGELRDMLAEAGVRTIFVPEMRRDIGLGDIHAFRALLRALRSERPDILHLNSSKAGGLGALAGWLLGVPRIVFTSHGLAFDEDRNPLERGAIWFATWCTFLMSDAVICISEDTARRARAMTSSRRVHLVYNGIGAFDLLPRAKARGRLVAALEASLPERIFWIGTIAELTRNKGLEYMLEACADMKLHGKKFIFLIVGEGGLRGKLEQLIRARDLSDTVFITGFLPDARALLPAFDLFALASIKEGLPYVLLEAGKAGLPVVVSDIPGNRDVAADSDMQVPPKDAFALARTIEEMIGDSALREASAQRLKARVDAMFSIDRMIRDTIALY